MIDRATLSKLFADHAAPLVLYARQWLDRGLAEDVVQEAYIRLMGQRKLPANPRAWLYCTVRNGAISQFRAQSRRLRREQATAPNETWFEAEAGQWIDGMAARSAMLDLPESQREIIALRLWGQLTLNEIAEVTGSSTSGVFDQYRAGLNALRKAMGVTCKTEDG